MKEFCMYSGLITVGETDQPDSDGLQPHHLSVRKFTVKKQDTHRCGKANLRQNNGHLHWHMSNL